MATVDVTVPATKEAYELMQGIAGFVRATKPAIIDGLDISDVGVLISAAMEHLLPAVKGVVELPAEATDESAEFALAVAIGAREVYKAVRD